MNHKKQEETEWCDGHSVSFREQYYNIVHGTCSGHHARLTIYFDSRLAMEEAA